MTVVRRSQIAASRLSYFLATSNLLATSGQLTTFHHAAT